MQKGNKNIDPTDNPELREKSRPTITKLEYNKKLLAVARQSLSAAEADLERMNAELEKKRADYYAVIESPAGARLPFGWAEKNFPQEPNEHKLQLRQVIALQNTVNELEELISPLPANLEQFNVMAPGRQSHIIGTSIREKIDYQNGHTYHLIFDSATIIVEVDHFGRHYNQLVNRQLAKEMREHANNLVVISQHGRKIYLLEN